MPALAAVRAANAAFAPAFFPVAVFVGGTSGIGRACAEAFARYTKGNAHIVIVGRNKSAADEIIASFPKPTKPEAKHEFVQCDVFLMRNIQATTASLRESLPKINYLVLSPGLFNLRGRDETAEGIDKRLGLHYYARWKFVYDLLPLVQKAKEAGEDAKVMSVLAAGHGGPVNLDDLGMKKSYNVAKAGLTSPTYTDLMFEVRSIVTLNCFNRLLSVVLLYPALHKGVSRHCVHPRMAWYGRNAPRVSYTLGSPPAQLYRQSACKGTGGLCRVHVVLVVPDREGLLAAERERRRHRQLQALWLRRRAGARLGALEGRGRACTGSEDRLCIID